MSDFSGLEATYDIIDEIGSGGGGTVYKAYHKRLQKYVVIKKTHDEVKNILNIRSEADILKNLRHLYLPQVLDFLELDNSIYTVMDYIPGESFQKLLKEGCVFKQKEVIKFAKQLTEALIYLHGQTPPIIHGDIKPANIMLMPTGDICLIDFNISSIFGENGAISVGYSDGYSPKEQYPREDTYEIIPGIKKENFIVEFIDNKIYEDKTEVFSREKSEDKTEAFSREKSKDKTEFEVGESKKPVKMQLKPSKSKTESKGNMIVHIDESSDIYSLGATLYYLLTGVRPNNAKETIVPISDMGKDISDGLCYIIDKCMAHEKKKRFDSTASLLKVLKNIDELDRRYKGLTLRKELTFVILFIMMGVSILSIPLGKKEIFKEKIIEYNFYVEQMHKLIEESNFEQIDDIYQKATKLFPKEIQSDYAKLLALYKEGEYNMVLQFAEENIPVIIDYNLSNNNYLMANCYSIAGNAAFELEDYLLAKFYFSKPLELFKENGYFYRDYAIVLARLYETEKAKEMLEEAIKIGLEQEELYQAQGEINYILAEWKNAEDNFLKCIDISLDDYVRMRAYIMLGMVYDKEEYFDDAIEKKINVLEKARYELPIERTIMINSKLIEAYTEYGNRTNDTLYYTKAIKLIESDQELGRRNYNNDNNLALLYRKTGELSNSNNILLRMITDYGENYNTYKRLAFLETDIQSMKKNEKRDYKEFLKYYQKAVELYKKMNEKNDDEMVYLDSIYNDLEKGRWFESK